MEIAGLYLKTNEGPYIDNGAEMKICCSCKIEKNYEEFHKNKASKDNHSNQCKICRTKYDSERWANNKESERARVKEWISKNKKYYERYEKGKKLRARYWPNLSIEEANLEFEKLMVEQNGKCKICGIDHSKLKVGLVVDHCHIAGDVRGLLCQNCNALIGMAKESAETLYSAIEYLKLKKLKITG